MYNLNIYQIIAIGILLYPFTLTGDVRRDT